MLFVIGLFAGASLAVFGLALAAAAKDSTEVDCFQ